MVQAAVCVTSPSAKARPLGDHGNPARAPARPGPLPPTHAGLARGDLIERSHALGLLSPVCGQPPHEPMCEKCQFQIMRRSKEGLFDHLVGARQKSCGDFETQCLGGLEVDDHIHFGGLFNRQIGWLFAT